MTLGQRPADHKLSAAELVALHAMPDRHPNALRHELTVTTEAALGALAHDDAAPADLAKMASDELDRRATATARLLRDCPALAAAPLRRA